MNSVASALTGLRSTGRIAGVQVNQMFGGEMKMCQSSNRFDQREVWWIGSACFIWGIALVLLLEGCHRDVTDRADKVHQMQMEKMRIQYGREKE
jgi:hypothetical protein